MSRTAAPEPDKPMNLREHQRDVGEKEHYAPQTRSGSDHEQDVVEHARTKANKNTTHRNEQTGEAMAEAERVRKDAERAA